jgi:hypothetical protein
VCLQSIRGHFPQLQSVRRGFPTTREKSGPSSRLLPPKTASQLRRFFGMLKFYRRFLPHADTTQAPGRNTLGSGASFQRPLPSPLPERENAAAAFARKSVKVSSDRVKPIYVLNQTDCGSTTFNPSASATPATVPPSTPPPISQTTRSGRHVPFPARFNTQATISAGGGMMSGLPQSSFTLSAKAL